MATSTKQRELEGTVKVGRWVYPAKRSGKTVTRNTKRDGSGDWEVTDAEFTPNEQPEAEAAPNIPGFLDEEPNNPDRDELRTAYEFIWDGFAVTAHELAAHLGVSVTRAKAVTSTLGNVGLTVTESRAGDKGELVTQSLKTYDEVDRTVAMANFEEAVPADVRIRSTHAHGGKVGAQHRKPGKSDWKVGSLCPQGHILEEDDIYVMASGRKQCRKCRRGYPSNV